MKKFTINCDFGGQLAPFIIYIGKPESGHHPLHFQADWLSKQRGGTIPGEVMEAISQLQELATKNGVSLEELCVYALGPQEGQEQEGQEQAEEEEQNKPAAASEDTAEDASENEDTAQQENDGPQDEQQNSQNSSPK